MLRLRALYERAGYRKYRCSHFEEYALYQQYQRFLPDAQVVTFTDLDGKLRAIKPDVTLSIAKTAQPARGNANAFIIMRKSAAQPREPHLPDHPPDGPGMHGAVDAAAQGEVVRLALQSLAALPVPTVLEVSHMGFVTGLLDALRTPPSARARLLDLLGRKNAHELRAAAQDAGWMPTPPTRCAPCWRCTARWARR